MMNSFLSLSSIPYVSSGVFYMLETYPVYNQQHELASYSPKRMTHPRSPSIVGDSR